MAASAWIKFDKSTYYGMIGTINYADASAGAFKCALVLATWTPATTVEDWSSISTHEHSNVNGYTTGGAALTGVTYTTAAGTDKWDSADPTWTATGSGITARYAVLYHVASGKVLRYCELEVGSNKVAAAGNDLVVQMASGGIFSLT
jgi:hypothetical protein